jgi:glycosyltransferase involved in cell wall biosynthesis
MKIENTKPKLLLIAGYFPPVRISTGSIRPWNLARCLIDLGWDVTVVTPKISIWDPKNLDNVENVKMDTEKMGLKMIYTDHQLKCLAPWRYNLPKGKIYWFFGGILRVIARFLGIQNWYGWVASALHACRKLRSNDVDVILATGAPFWGFEIAYQLSKRLKKPYIMDYRDLWTDDPWNPVSRRWVINQERRLLNKSAAITIVSPISGEVLSKKFMVNDKIHTITNGFDKNDVQNIQAKPFDHFSIIFAGMLIPPKRTLYPLFRVLNVIKQKNEITCNWKFHYFGPNIEEANKEVIECGLIQESVIHGNLPRKEVLPYIKGASLNVVLSTNSSVPTMEDKGVIPGKIFELIGMEASILPIVPKESAVESVLAEVGVECFSPDEIDEIANFMIECMNGHEVKMINKEKYSWEELSKKFDQLLKSIVQNYKE